MKKAEGIGSGLGLGLGLGSRVSSLRGGGEWVVLANREGIIVSLHGSVQRHTLYRPQDLIGRNVSVLAAQPHRDMHDTYLAKFCVPDTCSLGIQARVKLLSVNVRCSDGTITAALKQVHLDSGRDVFIATFFDLSELGAAFVLDATGTHVSWVNDSFSLLTGWTKPMLPIPVTCVFDFGPHSLCDDATSVVQVLRKSGHGSGGAFTCNVNKWFREDTGSVWKLGRCAVSMEGSSLPMNLCGAVRVETIAGSGATASVFRGTLLETGATVAVKSVKKSGTDLESIDREVHIHRLACSAGCPSIVALLQVMETQDDCHIVMEFMTGGTLKLLVCLLDVLSCEQTVELLSPICDALVFLHERLYIVHRDVKLENILLNNLHESKLCDFGVAVQKTSETWNEKDIKEGAGTVWYAAPEIYRSHEMREPYIGWPSDVWSFGCCVFCALTGDSDSDLADMVSKKQLEGFLDHRPTLPRSLKMLLCSTLKIEERQRPTARSVRDLLLIE